jgi:hypothetical protein
MEWTMGISTRTGEFRGEIIQGDAATQYVSLPTLLSSGLPEDSAERKTIRSHFHEWRIADETEYLQAFGSPHAASGRHIVFELAQGAERTLVPALALIRSIFRPKRFIFPLMFGPQALDRVCHLDHSQFPGRLVIDARWPAFVGERHGDFGAALSWMCSFPSARVMAASVHEHARAGRIGLLLPDARVRMRVCGKRIGRTMFATSISPREIDATESPFPFATGHSGRVTYFNRSHNTRNMDNLVLADRSIPVHPDGSVDLTDSEWEIIGPTLTSEDNRRRLHNPRHLFDGILRKHALGLSWNKTPYKTGSRANATFAFLRWKSTGSFQAGVNFLKAVRQQNAGSAVGLSWAQALMTEPNPSARRLEP